ncbi:MAG: AAA family ATPase, partial [Myxococcota bacterium]|nr:AAA family ATPase [Myxococcota bacterium]
MLRELRIRDVAIIEDLEVQFASGLNVISGETGAGKSIILGALGLVLGARSSGDLVRTGSESAEVQARVDCSPAVAAVLEGLDLPAPEEDEGLLLRRIVKSSGRSRAYIGDSAVPVAALRRLAGVLVDYASQHEHRVLLDEARHLAILDSFAGLVSERDAVREAVQSLQSLLGERARLARLDHERRTRQDYLRFQLDELEAASPNDGEMEDLAARRTRLRHAEELVGKARQIEESLYSGGAPALDAISRSVDSLRELAAIDSSLAPLLADLEAALIAVEEVGRDIAAYGRDVRSGPQELEEV